MQQEEDKRQGLLRGDPLIWVVMFFLCMISTVVVYSATSNMTYGSDKHFWDPIISHCSMIALGVIVAWVLQWIPNKLYIVLMPLGHILAIVLLLAVMFMGENTNEATRSIPIGGIHFQPSELAKLTLMGTLATLFNSGYDKTTGRIQTRHFLIGIGIAFLTCAFIVKDNLSTAVMILGVVLIFAWFAKPPIKWLFGICASLIAIGFLAFIFLAKVSPDTAQAIGKVPGMTRVPTWASRVQAVEKDTIPADPKLYDLYNDKKRQFTHSKIAIGTSGILGCGPGKSEARDYLPQPYSDFVYSIILEEGGLAVGAVVMVLYLLLFLRCMKIAKQCKRRFPNYLITGLSIMLTMQAMVNMAVAVGAIPVTGQTLPLISRGGTSILVSGAFIGVMLSVSRAAKKKEEASPITKKVEDNE